MQAMRMMILIVLIIITIIFYQSVVLLLSFKRLSIWLYIFTFDNIVTEIDSFVRGVGHFTVKILRTKYIDYTIYLLTCK